jgi:TonB family protein
VPVPSQPPPSHQIPGHSHGGGIYLIGAVVLLGAAGGLLWWKTRTPSSPTTAQTTTVVSSAPPKRDDPPPLFAPPPPPKLDDEPDAGVDAGVAPKGPSAPAGPGPCACGGQPGNAPPALQAALRSRGAGSTGCYRRALQRSEVSGSMTVSVQVGPGGQVCSASVVNDTVNSGEVSSCVLSRFRGQSFPPPQGGCVTVNIPISFTIKQ